MRRTLLLVTASVTLGIVVGVAIGRGTLTSDNESPPVALPDDLVPAAALASFDACDDFLDHVRSRALEHVGPWGLDGNPGWYAETTDDAAAGDDSDAGGSDGADYSGTNVQEVGIDEPDRVKSDGTYLYVARETQLTILDITGDTPVEVGSIPLRDAWDARLLLEDDRLLVTSSTFAAIPFADEVVADSVPAGGEVTTMTLVDVADPSSPQVVERLVVDGQTVSARLADGVVRVIVRTRAGADLSWEYPQGGGLRAERRALDANRAIIEASSADDWLPWFIHRTADGTTTERTLLECDQIAQPSEFAGLDVLSVLTLDLSDNSLRPDGGDTGLLASGETVYAATDHLYVATTRWIDWEALPADQRRDTADDAVSQIHVFDLTTPTATTYVGSGSVPGWLIGQWAMSEHDGHLRVASTVGDAWGLDLGTSSHSLVTVFRLGDGDLEQVGQVDRLGPTERIYAVRFIGDVGYVVTFRQTDPLYTLDLRDPSAPVATGELKINGYSAYLHPMGDDLLLGIGQDADEQGRTLGTQVSLFDVSDPSAPTRLDQLTIADGHSDVEHDHHAFLHWPATGLTVVPYQRWSWDPEAEIQDSDSGAIALTVDREDGIVEAGRLSHLEALRRELEQARGGVTSSEPAQDALLWDLTWQGAIQRSMVRGDRLLTLSNAGVMVHDLDTLEGLGWYRFTTN